MKPDFTLRSLAPKEGHYAVGNTGWRVRRDSDPSSSTVAWDIFDSDGNLYGWEATRREAVAVVRAALGETE